MNAKKPSKKRQPMPELSTEGDVITVSDIGSGAVVAAGRGAVAQMLKSADQPDLERWLRNMESKIEALPGLSKDERVDASEQVQKIAVEAAKGKKADPKRLEKLVNTLAVMSQDIFEVAIATLMNPLAGIGLVLKKVGDKSKIEPVPDS